MKNKKIIFYIILIIVVLVLVFLSQQAVSRSIGGNLISAVTNQASAFLAKGTNFSIPAIPNVFSNITNQVQSGGEAIQNTINQTEQKISDTQKNIENYFSGIKDAVTGKENNNCTVPASTN